MVQKPFRFRLSDDKGNRKIIKLGFEMPPSHVLLETDAPLKSMCVCVGGWVGKSPKKLIIIITTTTTTTTIIYNYNNLSTVLCKKKAEISRGNTKSTVGTKSANYL